MSASMASALVFAQSKAYAQGRWDHEADVVVVGTGAAGSSAALFASQGDSKVLLVEKGVAYGGTTGISAGVFHIPNNALMRRAGVADPREDAIRYYARTAYPAMYSAKAPNFGLFENEYNLIAAFYDNASNAIDGLVAMGALQIAPWLDFEGKGWPDYYSHLPEDTAPRGRQLVPKNLTTGEPMMSGIELLRQLRVVLDRRSIPVLLRHRATRLVLNDKRQVIGLEATTDEGQRTVAIRARKGVIFGSGGFTHNRELRMKMLRGPVFSGCGPVTNEGDLIYIAGAVGAKFTNMAHAWWHPQVLELALQTTATNLSGGNPGDSMLVVNKYGTRVVNEMKRYNDRGQAFFDWDPVRVEYRNMLLFMIFDQRTRDLYARQQPIPAKGASAPWLLSANTFEELSRVIDNRLAQLEERVRFRLDSSFDANFRITLSKYNDYAVAGVDPEFHRGEATHEISGHGPRREGNTYPNITMCPLSPRGPYYAVILCGGTVDTKGGPKINPKAQMLDGDDRPIPGLYGAGNCIGAPAGEAYWAGGCTIGSALTFGQIAGRNAAAESVKSEK